MRPEIIMTAAVEVAGCMASRRATRPEMAANGRNPSTNPLTRFAALFESQAARYRRYVSFTNSAGWTVSGPTLIQRAAPPTENPIGVKTRTKRPMLARRRKKDIVSYRRYEMTLTKSEKHQS